MDQTEEKPKTHNLKTSNPDGYVLVVVDDSPYQEGAEYWFDSDLQELINLVIEEWDEIGEANFICLGRFKYGQKVYKIEDILPLSEGEDEKFGSFDPELYPIIDTDDTYKSVYVCLGCERFQSSSGKCPNCQSKLYLAGDDSIPLY